MIHNVLKIGDIFKEKISPKLWSLLCSYNSLVEWKDTEEMGEDILAIRDAEEFFKQGGSAWYSDDIREELEELIIYMDLKDVSYLRIVNN